MNFRACALSTLAVGALTAGLMLAPATSLATNYTVGVESDTTGFVGSLFAAFPDYQVASDGEVYFDPFNAGYDTSDGINFSSVPYSWTQAAGGNWTSIGNQTWVLPASSPGGANCGSENEPTCEYVGHFVSPSAWNSSLLGTYYIYDANNSTVSDVIDVYNNSAGANLLFYSDPTGVPEPGALTLMGIGLALIGFAVAYRRRTRA